MVIVDIPLPRGDASRPLAIHAVRHTDSPYQRMQPPSKSWQALLE